MSKKCFGQKEMYLGAFTGQLARRDYKKEKRKNPVTNAFPIEEPFKNRGDLDKYLCGNTIQCLICGREFKSSLGKHILVHGITAKEYKIKYQIPTSTPLTTINFSLSKSLNISEKQREHMANISKLSSRKKTIAPPEWRVEENRDQLKQASKKVVRKSGGENSNSVLTNEQALSILKEYSENNGYGAIASLARKYTTTENVIRALVKRRTYKNISNQDML